MMKRWLIILTVFLSLGLHATSHAMEPVVESVSYVASGDERVMTVAVTFTISDAENDASHVALIGHDALSRQHFPMATFAEGKIYEKTFAPGTHTVVWETSADVEDPEFSMRDFVVYVQVSDTARIAPGQYLIVDVSGGTTATQYPVEYKNCVDTSKDLYKTDRILLRELPDGSFAGVYEVTQRQYELVTGETPSEYGDKAMGPVEQISWNDITGSGNYDTGFFKLLRDKTGLTTVDLPDDTAWEYACRAGATNHFNDYTQNYGKGGVWNETVSDYTLDNLGWYFNYFHRNASTRIVGGKQPNAWGLFDMHGNVFEWVTSAYGQDRSIRSGSFLASAAACRSGSQGSFKPDGKNGGLGFRLAIPAVGNP